MDGVFAEDLDDDRLYKFLQVSLLLPDVAHRHHALELPRLVPVAAGDVPTQLLEQRVAAPTVLAMVKLRGRVVLLSKLIAGALRWLFGGTSFSLCV